MRIAHVAGALAALAFAPAAQAQAFPFFLDLDLCIGQPAQLGNLGAQCVYPDESWVFQVDAGGALSGCIVDSFGSPGIVFDQSFGMTWSKTGNQVTMDLSPIAGDAFLTGFLAGGGTSGGVLVDSAGLATPLASQVASWDGVKSPQQTWDDCVNGTGPVGNPVEFIEGCDPAYCADFGPGTGPNGGTLYQFFIPAADAPLVDDVEASCFDDFGAYPASDLIVHMPVAAFALVTFDTCAVTPGDSSIAIYDGDPALGGYENYCSEDSGGPSFCSTIGDQFLTPVIAGADPFFVVDEYFPGDWWGSDRVFNIEVL